MVKMMEYKRQERLTGIPVRFQCAMGNEKHLGLHSKICKTSGITN